MGWSWDSVLNTLTALRPRWACWRGDFFLRLSCENTKLKCKLSFKIKCKTSYLKKISIYTEGKKGSWLMSLSWKPAHFLPNLRNSVYICYCIELMLKGIMVPILFRGEPQWDSSHNSLSFHCSPSTDENEPTRGIEICLWISVDKLNSSNYRPCEVLFSVEIRYICQPK